MAPDSVLADINPRALDFARANAALAGLDRVRFAQGDLFAPVQGEFDFIVANPPYLVDAVERTYRHGGGAWGGGLSERIVAEGLPRLAPGGRLVLYTGAAMVEGRDPLREAVEPVLRPRAALSATASSTPMCSARSWRRRLTTARSGSPPWRWWRAGCPSRRSLPTGTAASNL